MATLTSMAGLSSTFSLENDINNLRDVSFSSYLNSAEETFVRRLAESSRKVSANISAQEDHLRLGRKTEEDGEIGVFSAEKYFKGVMDEDGQRIGNTLAGKYKNKKEEQTAHVDAVPIKPKDVGPGTPTARSESSWNSQNPLLQRVLRQPSQTKTNKVHGKGFLAVLGCKCSCSDKDSVGVDEHVGETSFKKSPNAGLIQGKETIKEHSKTSFEVELERKPRSGSSWVKEEIRCQNLDKLGIGLKKENCFTFPTLNSVAGKLQLELEDEEVKQRKSLEAFGSPGHERRKKTLGVERRLTMLSWDATPRTEEIKFSASPGEAQNDNESDASSDLFEIESLTGKVASFLGRQASDATSGCVTPTTCYAPSEASIEWSVVTASAADFSIMSDYEELRPPKTAVSPTKAFHTTRNSKTTCSKEIPRRRPSLLLGCRSQKAVNVAGNAYITDDKSNFDPRLRGVSDSCISVTTFQADQTKLKGFNSRHGQPAFATQSIPRSQSPHSSNIVYIQ